MVDESQSLSHRRRRRWLRDQPERTEDVFVVEFRFAILNALEQKVGREVEILDYPHRTHVTAEGIDVPYF